MRKRFLAIALTGLFTANLLGGCSGMSKDTIIPSDIINKAVSINEKPKSYYSEASMVMHENNQVEEKSTIKEWVDNSENTIKRRSEASSDVSGESIVTNDGKQILIYMKKENKAMRMNGDMGLNGETNNYKQQLMMQLGGISKTHDITYKGEENISGFKTYHLNAIPKEKNNIIGEVNYWIDESNWFVVKSTSESANSKMEMEYTKLDFSPKFDSSMFVQDIPSNVEMIDLDKQSTLAENTIDMAQAEKIVGKPILTLKESSGYKLKNVTFSDLANLKHKEINQTYEKNGADALILTTIVFYDGEGTEDESDLKIGDEKDVVVRGKKGLAMEEPIKTITWSEDGFNYNLLIQDPTLTIDNGMKLVEGLQSYK